MVLKQLLKSYLYFGKMSLGFLFDYFCSNQIVHLLHTATLIDWTCDQLWFIICLLYLMLLSFSFLFINWFFSCEIFFWRVSVDIDNLLLMRLILTNLLHVNDIYIYIYILNICTFQFEDIDHHGTKVIIYNLWLNDDGIFELDFDDDDEVILCILMFHIWVPNLHCLSSYLLRIHIMLSRLCRVSASA